MTDEPNATPTDGRGSSGTLDAYGRRRSSRSTSTGPGSRGGNWHDPEFRAAYYRKWRLDHPDYRKSENRRRKLAKTKARKRLGRMVVTVSMACQQIIKEEVEATSMRAVAARLGVSHSMVHRVVHYEEVRGVRSMDHAMWSSTIDIIVLNYTMARLLKTIARLRREGRMDPGTG